MASLISISCSKRTKPSPVPGQNICFCAQLSTKLTRHPKPVQNLPKQSYKNILNQSHASLKPVQTQAWIQNQPIISTVLAFIVPVVCQHCGPRETYQPQLRVTKPSGAAHKCGVPGWNCRAGSWTCFTWCRLVLHVDFNVYVLCEAAGVWLLFQSLFFLSCCVSLSTHPPARLCAASESVSLTKLAPQTPFPFFLISHLKSEKL